MLLGREFDRALGFDACTGYITGKDERIAFWSQVYCMGRTRSARKESMRKNLEAICLGALGVMVWITYQAFHGPSRLPDKIPTHFNLAGNPDGWGSPRTLQLLPTVALAIYLVISIVALFPSAFNYPVRVTAENRARLEELALDMIACLKVELVCFFAGLQWAIIAAVRNGRGTLSPWIMPPVLVVIFGTVGWYLVAMFRTSRGGAS
jgi:uncharacterized membrane protein